MEAELRPEEAERMWLGEQQPGSSQAQWRGPLARCLGKPGPTVSCLVLSALQWVSLVYSLIHLSVFAGAGDKVTTQ